MVAVASYAEELQNENKNPYDRRDGDFGVDSRSSRPSDSEGGNGNSEVVCEYFYDALPPPMPSPAVDEANAERFHGDDDGGCGIDDERKLKKNDKKGDGEMKGMMMTTTAEEKDLIEALNSLEEEFARAYESGRDVSRILEAGSMPRLSPVLDEIDDNRKIFQSLKFRGLLSPSSQPSSSGKCFSSSSSKTSSTWTDRNSHFFDGCESMESVSHSFTLQRLYSCEKKLYKEVKVGEEARKCYLQKLSHLSNLQQGKGGGGSISSNATSELADLYNKILLAGKIAESITKQINKLRDEELQPQIGELLHGLMRTWTIMLEGHETQSKIMNQVKSFTCSDNGKLGNYSQRLATYQLESELQTWLASFTEYLSTQKSYMTCLFGYFSKLVDPAASFQRFTGKKKHSTLNLTNGPALLSACKDWSASLESIAENDVKFSMKCLANDVHALWVQQGEEQNTKRKVQSLAKEVEKRAFIDKAAETTPKVVSSKPATELRLLSRMNIVRYKGEDVKARKCSALDLAQERLETEKNSMEKTRMMTI